MASKTRIYDNLVKTFIRLQPTTSKPCDYVTVQRASYVTAKSLPSNLRGSNIYNLPGNRLLQSPFALLLQSFCRMKTTHVVDTKVSLSLGVPGIEVLEDFTPLEDEELRQDICTQINKNLDQGEAGRLFAVLYIRGMQHKVTTEDTIIVKYDFPPNVGDRIRLEKVLAVGGKDFSLIGQPLLNRDLVRVEATVVEKTLSHNRIWFVYRKRKNFKILRLYREKYTMLVINSIQVAQIPAASEEIDNSQDLARV